MRKLGYLVVMIALGAGVASAQRTPNYGQMYCSGVYSNEAMPNDTYLISGEEARSQITFQQGNYVYINTSASVGDEFQVIRPVKRRAANEWFAGNPYATPDRPNWFKWESWLRRAMGTFWKDIGKIRVVKVEGGTAIAQVVQSCDYFQRGDYVRPFTERPAPAFKTAKFDRFAPASGRSTGQVVGVEEPDYYTAQAGTGNLIYVNLGSGQGVKVGDYFRMFRYQGTRDETAYQHRGYQYKAWGFGKAPRAYGWKDLPREVVGEGIVLRTGPNSSTVLVTYSLREIYQGDYAEVEEPAPVMEEPPAPAPAPAANRSPSMSCSTDRPRVAAGERVRVTAQATDPDGDALRYAWRSNGGQIVGSGSSVMLDTTGLAPGRYMVTGQASDGISAAADCSVEVTVQPPAAPAEASKANECLFRLSSAGVDNVCKRILDDVALRLKNDPQASVVLIGYADPAEGGAARLSAQRADNAKQYLLSSGIADARVDTRSAGGQVGAGRQNRRVDVIWVPAGATY
jgi:outer membrane protein OmpA-like peptidoglycan-associated protein